MKLYYYMPLFFMFVTKVIVAQSLGFIVETVEIVPGAITQLEKTVAVDELNYTEGGITFTYASGVFVGTPNINITIELLNAVLTTSDSYIATVTYNSSVATGVVARHINDVIQDAPTDSIIIHLQAIDTLTSAETAE